MRSTGSGSMITPVENGSTCSGATFSWRASAMQVARARTRPSSPVPALALPVLIDHGADVAARQVLAAHLHRRGAEAVLREHAGHRGALVEQERR